MKLLLSVFLFFSAGLKAQKKPNFFIEGKISLLSGSGTIILMSNNPDMIYLKINKDGTFKGSAYVSKPERISVKTDSSFGDAIWLMPGRYTVNFKEIKRDGEKGYYLRTSGFKGPKAAAVFNNFSQTRYSVAANIPQSQRFSVYRNYSINYIDSILKVYPQCISLPAIINTSSWYIGSEKEAEYLELLNPELLKTSEAKNIKSYLLKRDFLKKEVFFKDFALKDTGNNLIKLSEVKAKIILIDFWATDCPACHSYHQGPYDSLYRKYHQKGFEIVSICLDKKRKDWVGSIMKDNMRWINLSELKGRESKLSKYYVVDALPASFWLDSERKIFIDGLTEQQIEEILSK